VGGEPVLAEQTERKRFPALDPEPPPASVARRVAICAGWLAGAAVLSALVLLIAAVYPGGTHRVSPAVGPVKGKVALLTPNRQLAVVTPGSPKPMVLPSLGYEQYYPDPTSDGRFLVAGDGTVIALSHTGMSVVRTAVSLDLSTQKPPGGDALADHDQAMVVLTEVATGTYTSTTHAGLAVLSSGRFTDLGLADTAAGDPAALGVFVSVPAPGPPVASTSVSFGQPDTRVELRDVGHPVMVLASATELSKSVGLAASDPVSLSPMPDPTGDRIAIGVSPVTGNGTEGIAVVDRSGHVLGAVPASEGPPPGFGVSWAPADDSLAFPVMTASGAGVAVWSVGEALTVRSGPVTAALPGQCQWSPDGATILCVVLEAGNQPAWEVADGGGGPVTALAAPGSLLSWLP
jgi:hypothetical protein